MNAAGQWRRVVVATVCGALATVLAPCSLASDLPPDRADMLYHSYDGDGAQIDGPALLVRKRLGKSVSINGRYYVDSISSASVDVIATASPYTEERTETGFGVDYLRGNTVVSVGATNSEENDFTGNSGYLSVSQALFGSLTTVTMTYAAGDDEVRRRGDDTFRADVDRQQYGLDVSQILTPNVIVGLNFEAITDEGFLNNPYRVVRYVDPTSTTGVGTQSERYPNTRTSNALALRGRYFLQHRAAMYWQYRYFSDTWDIEAHTAEAGYTHSFGDHWLFDVKYRYYQQEQASFYSDLFSRVDEQNFLARDKELSTFSDHTLRIATAYSFVSKSWGPLQRGTINLSYDFIRFDYDNFRNVNIDAPVGEEPLFGFDANVFTLFVSFWY